MRLGGQTITVVNTGTQTGNTDLGTPIYGDPVETVVAGCSLQQHQTRREITLTDVIESRYRLFAPPGTPLMDTSTVLADGNTFIVDGQPALWQTRTGTVHHVECYLRMQVG